jgi:ribonuclease E
MDKARVNVGRISQFGMMEMSRQRIAKNINDAIHLECPHCEGRGRVKSVEAMALSFLRKVHAAAAKGQLAEVRGGLPLEVAYYLLNRKKRELAQIENNYDIVVTIKGKPSFLLNQLELDTIKREKPVRDDVADQLLEVPEDVALATEDLPGDEAVAVEGVVKKKRKRRRKKKSGAERLADQSQEQPDVVEEPTVSAAVEADENVPAQVDAALGTASGTRKRPRRSRSKKKVIEETELPVEQAQIPVPVVASLDVEPIAAGKKKPSRPRKTVKPSQEAVAQPETVAVSSDEQPAPKRPNRRSSAKHKQASSPAAVHGAGGVSVASETPEVAVKPKRKRKVSTRNNVQAADDQGHEE